MRQTARILNCLSAGLREPTGIEDIAPADFCERRMCAKGEVVLLQTIATDFPAARCDSQTQFHQLVFFVLWKL
jgi:hypothetical protein